MKILYLMGAIGFVIMALDFSKNDVTSPRVISRVIHGIKRVFPKLKDIEFIQYWPGRNDTMRDLLPTMGRDQYLLCSPICLFVHILVIPIVLSLFIALIGPFPLYMYLSEELATCLQVDGTCIYCNAERKLRPYPTGRYKESMMVQCPVCGQTLETFPKSQ